MGHLENLNQNLYHKIYYEYKTLQNGQIRTFARPGVHSLHHVREKTIEG